MPSPLNFDWSADYIACKLQEALRVTFREEIAQNLVPVGSKKVAGAASNKQEARYTVLPMHTTFVIRHLAFCTEFQRYVFLSFCLFFLNRFLSFEIRQEFYRKFFFRTFLELYF